MCNHAGGPLGQGKLDGNYMVCPLHNWKFHRVSGIGEPGSEDDAVPSYKVKVKNGRVPVRTTLATARKHKPHAPHPLARPVRRKPGPVRVAGISATAQDPKNPRYSTSEALLEVTLAHARTNLKCPTKLIKLADLKFRACEGYYSKSAQACTWPCSITQRDDTDEMTEVYETVVHWADVVLLATPIRWGHASSLYFRMAKRLNYVQNQITIKDRVLLNKKVASFIITGGQDNIQAVAGQLWSFFSELGGLSAAIPAGRSFARLGGRGHGAKCRRRAVERGLARRHAGTRRTRGGNRLRAAQGKWRFGKTLARWSQSAAPRT